MVSRSVDGVVSVHAVATVTAQIGNDSSVVLRSETWADLRLGNAKRVVSEPNAPASNSFVITEETVIVDGAAYRRSGDSAWKEVTADIGSMVLTGIDSTGEDLADSLRQFTLGEACAWTVATSENVQAAYRCNDDATARTVTVELDADGTLSSISVNERPAGARSESPLTYRTTLTFDDLGTTTVDVPSDLTAS